MSKWGRNLILSAAAAIALAGCDGEFIEVCMNCFEHDAEKPLTDAQVRSLKVNATVKTLPAEAHNVYFEESCGMDCRQIFRFDLPSENAHQTMRRFSKVDIAPLSKHDQSDLLAAQMDGPPLSWWLKEAVPDAEGVAPDINIGQWVGFVLVPEGKTTRVYMLAFDM
jgi:hypothetical protein